RAAISANVAAKATKVTALKIGRTVCLANAPRMIVRRSFRPISRGTHTERMYSYQMSATTAVNGLCLADELAVLAAQVDVGTHRLLTCIRRFDESEEWGHQGARTCADWLAWRIGLAPGAAREKVRVARALGKFPAIDQAMAAGRLSYAKVRALTRVATT